MSAFVYLKKPNPTIDRHKDIHYMFTAELAKPILFGIKNKYHNRNMTITGSENTGTINAFGSPGYTWDKFCEFLTLFGKNYNTSNFAIFQFNMLPPDW